MKEKCPYCGEEIHSEYIFCPHCENRLKEKNYKTKNPFHLDMKDAEMKATRKGVLIKLTGMIILLIIGLAIGLLKKHTILIDF